MLTLRRLEPGDADGMLEWMHDPAIGHSMQTDFLAMTRPCVLAFIEAAQTDGTAVHRACVDDQNTYLGTVSLKNIDAVSRNAEYAITMRRAAQGTGAARFATDAILRHAFEALDLERVYLYVRADNRRAQAFYQKYGFAFEGEFKKHLFAFGEFHDLRWYRMLKEEYAGREVR